MTTSSSCGRLTRRWFSWMARRGAKGEIVRDRTCVFCLSAMHVNRAAMNKRDRFFGWMNTLFFLSFPLTPYSLFPLPFSLSFENENWLESRFSRWLIKVGKLCGIMYVSLYLIFTPRDENADVRFSANTWHDRKEKRSIVENVAYVTFFNLTWREGCCVWTRLKVIVYEIVQGSPRFLSFRNCELRPGCVKYRACAYREFSDEIYANSETGCLIIWLREGKIGFGSRWPRKSVFLPPWGQSIHPLWFIAFNNNACDNDLMDPE